MITENGCIKYEIPEDVKKLITIDFLKEFRKQLFRIHDYYSLGDGEEFGATQSTGTSGWHLSFFKACMNTGNERLYDYTRELQWYDYDIFNYDLAELMVENKIVLRDMRDIIADELGINKDDIVMCDNCVKYFTKDSVIEIEDTDENYGILYMCLNCDDSKHIENGYRVTKYYKDLLREAEDYRSRRKERGNETND